MSGGLTWRNATSEEIPYLDGLDCWIGSTDQQDTASAVLVSDPDGNLSWQVTVMVDAGGGFQHQKVLGGFPSLVAAQQAVNAQLSPR